MNHMVESSRQKDVIQKLKSCLKQKSQEIRRMKGKLHYYDRVRDSKGMTENKESESQIIDKEELDRRVSRIYCRVSLKNGGGRWRSIVQKCKKYVSVVPYLFLINFKTGRFF